MDVFVVFFVSSSACRWKFWEVPDLFLEKYIYFRLFRWVPLKFQNHSPPKKKKSCTMSVCSNYYNYSPQNIQSYKYRRSLLSIPQNIYIYHLESTWRNSHEYWLGSWSLTNRHLLGVASHLLSPSNLPTLGSISLETTLVMGWIQLHCNKYVDVRSIDMKNMIYNIIYM